MTKRFCVALILITALCFAGSACAGRIVEPTVEEYYVQDPHPEFYTFEEGARYATDYKDPTLEIHVTEGIYQGTAWMAARIKVAYPAQLRTALYNDKYGQPGVAGERVAKYAEKKKAIFAINDDWCMNKPRAGAVFRQGVKYRLLCDESRNTYDILVIDGNGDLHVFQHATNADIENFDGTIVNAFVFGPLLVKDSQAVPVTENHGMGAFSKAQRMAIGQIGPLEYICVCSEGPEDPDENRRTGTQGLKLEEFGQLIASFGDVKICYNLDGGSSSTMVFRGLDRRGNDTFWTKINAPKNPKIRDAGGSIYFVSAWVPDEGETGAAADD